MRDERNNPLISVIVPVYNVAEYLEECIASLVGQTYRNLEIILINDGSTDSSGEICTRWAAKDSRIVLIEQKNSGQAAARNRGMEVAKGGLVTFVDSDDWIAADMIGKLYEALNKYDADISMCEAYTENAEGKFSDNSLQQLGVPAIDMQENKEFILTVRYTLWSKLYKKRLFTDNGVTQPPVIYEDVSIIPILYALSEKVACVNEPLYYYRYRADSTIRNVENIDARIGALQNIVDGFKDRGLMDAWADVVHRICTERGLILMRQVYPMLIKRFRRFCMDYDGFLKKNFHVGLSDISRNFHTQCEKGTVSARLLGNYNLAVFGSYNLMIVAKTIMSLGMPDFMEYHDSFSSLISVASNADDIFYDLDLAHENAYREKHLIQDMTKTFMRKSPCEYKDIDFFLIDFLEERFDIGEINGNYFTLSDAFLDIRDKMDIRYAVLSRSDERVQNLWKESCNKFVDRIKKYIDPHKIILVRMPLCDKYGTDIDKLKNFEDVCKIRETNQILESYYDYFMEICPEAMEVSLDDLYIYTDEEYRHGCYPWHMNSYLYWMLHFRVLGEMKKYDGAKIDEVVNKTFENKGRRGSDV